MGVTLVAMSSSLGPLHDKLFNFFILAGELGGKRLLASGKVLLMSIEQDTTFP